MSETKAIYKTVTPLEHDEQTALFQWAAYNLLNYPDLEWMHAIPNGAKLPFSKNKKGQRFSRQATHLIEEGLKAGVSDVFLPAPRKPYHGLYIEMKRIGEKPTPDQRAFSAAMNRAGYRAVVCEGFDAAKDEILAYLSLGKWSE